MKKFIAMFLGVQSPLSYLTTLLIKGRYVGADQLGNKYYVGKARKNYAHERRFVLYKNGEPEASQVPAEFHGWLHHQTDIFPDPAKPSTRKPWQAPHEQNLTGTNMAYFPRGHELGKGQRNKATGDYEAWIPE